MQFIKPSVEIITEPDLFKRIELAARTCYKSEDKIAPGSDMKLFKRLVASGHESTLEHSNIVVQLDQAAYRVLEYLISSYEQETGLPHYLRRDAGFLVSGNLRAWRSLAKVFPHHALLVQLFGDHPGFADISLSCVMPAVVLPAFDAHIVPAPIDDTFSNPDRHNIITARFICDRGVSHELVRHRCLSFSQESTRYVNYKEGAQFIEPWWLEHVDENIDEERRNNVYVRDACFLSELLYTQMIEEGNATPQKARAVLNNALKTEVVATGTVEMWKKLVLPLRLSKAAHPDIRRIMTLFCEQLDWKELIE